ncbi:uncharacterized protein LOC130654817 [Hydractinia symbiolongicarpus]|uniref:uncharacterized protein LOC130654817 n=1 Tax=Hydractinia symbiolongicarpus TaxID=13093 RepID=UPI0025514147|nr:uncharacterized protein LOC130654817 [Hydractinia symbiolongicarpus]
MEPTEILQKLKNDDRNEETRIEDMTEALTWLFSQLKYLKEQDKRLMKEFNHIRERINTIKETSNARERGRSLFDIYHIEEEAFIEARRCNLNPFDEEPADGKSLRRRAFSNVELNAAGDSAIFHRSFKESF